MFGFNMTSSAIVTSNHGRTVPEGLQLPAGVDLESTIIFETDGGAVERDGRVVAATWKVICGEDIARLPSEVCSNLAYGATGDPSSSFFVHDEAGVLRLYVPNDGGDLKAIFHGAAESGVTIIGSNPSLRRTVDSDGLVIRRTPDFQGAMQPVELGSALREVREMREAREARLSASPHPVDSSIDL